MIKVEHEFRFKIPNFDLTNEMEKGANIIGQEIRGNIKRQTDLSESRAHTPNAPAYRAWKEKHLGHSKPLIARGKTLVTPGSYIVKRIRKNFVTLTLTTSRHPFSKATIADIGKWNQQGTNRIPAREFFGTSRTAGKRVVAMVADKITKLTRG